MVIKEKGGGCMRRNKNHSKHTYIWIIAILSLICVLELILNVMFYQAKDSLSRKITKLETEKEQLSQTLHELEETIRSEEDLRNMLVNKNTIKAGTILDKYDIFRFVDEFFYENEIEEGDPVYQRINGKSYKENPNIALSDLRYLKVLHYNFNHEVQVGELIVNKEISTDVLNIFRELFEIEYEIESMYLIDNYWTGNGADTDAASIDANNTSAFCYRKVTGGSGLSNHAYGYAIDINPQQNPYVYRSNGRWKWYHDNADAYIDRTTGDPHMIVKGDKCYEIFVKYGFSWGGEWSNPMDYQHFER